MPRSTKTPLAWGGQEVHCSPSALLPQSKLQLPTGIKIESWKGQRIQKEPAQAESRMGSSQSKTNEALGKDTFIDPHAECRGSAEILKTGLSKASIIFLMVALHFTAHCSLSLVSSSFYLSFLVTV